MTRKYPIPPQISKSKINKAGKLLLTKKCSFKEYLDARDLVEQWRACHGRPINTFQATLRDKLKASYKNSKDNLYEPIVAQRLKRMPTIIDKLDREPCMKLTTMQDIGGVRAIVGSVEEVYKLSDKYYNSSKFRHTFLAEYDYIKNPRSADGYRSLHLIYKYKSKIAPEYNGLKIEIQIRSQLQHTWATAVESMGTFLGQNLKSRQGEQKWLDFFALVSSVFAYQEETTIIPRFNHLSQDEIHKLIAKHVKKYHILDTMEALSVAIKIIEKKKRSTYYHLIILNSKDKTVEILAYNRESLGEATGDYYAYEKKAIDNPEIEPVLVGAGSLNKLKIAFPNFFLDIKDFIVKVEEIIN